MTVPTPPPPAPGPATAAHSDADLERRFAGLQRLYGVQGAARIRRAHVAVIGIGGVGSWTAEALARSGVGTLTLIDMDHIAESNVNRQIHALTPTLGQAKVHAMRERIADIHPGCTVRCVDDFVTPQNWPSILGLPPGQDTAVDAIIDACDHLPAKQALCHWARQTAAMAAPVFITIGAAGGKRLAHLVELDDLAHATHDPLLAQLRNRLRKHHNAPRQGKRMGIACVFSRETVAPPDPSCQLAGTPDGSLNCHGYGSTVAVTATFGQCAAGWVLDQIARRPDH